MSGFKREYPRDHISNIPKDGESGVKVGGYSRKVIHYEVCCLHSNSLIIIAINGVERINDEVKSSRSNMAEKIFRQYSNDLVMYRCFFIVLTSYMPARKRLTD